MVGSSKQLRINICMRVFVPACARVCFCVWQDTVWCLQRSSRRTASETIDNYREGATALEHVRRRQSKKNCSMEFTSRVNPDAKRRLSNPISVIRRAAHVRILSNALMYAMYRLRNVLMYEMYRLRNVLMYAMYRLRNVLMYAMYRYRNVLMYAMYRLRNVLMY